MLTGFLSFAFVSGDGSFPFLLQGLIPNKHFASHILSQHLLLENSTGWQTGCKKPWSSRHCFSVLELLEQSSTDWVTSTADMYCHTALEVRSPKSRCWQSWLLLRAVRKASVLSLSLWLVGGSLLPVFLCIIWSPCLTVSVSQYLKPHMKYH